MKKQHLSILFLSILSLNAIAQDPRNSNIKVSAKAQAGCEFTIEDVHYGDISAVVYSETQLPKEHDLKIKCSKNANTVLSSETANIVTTSLGTFNYLKIFGQSEGNDDVFGFHVGYAKNGKCNGNLSSDTVNGVWFSTANTSFKRQLSIVGTGKQETIKLCTVLYLPNFGLMEKRLITPDNYVGYVTYNLTY